MVEFRQRRGPCLGFKAQSHWLGMCVHEVRARAVGRLVTRRINIVPGWFWCRTRGLRSDSVAITFVGMCTMNPQRLKATASVRHFGD